jgi:hypothetical protein
MDDPNESALPGQCLRKPLPRKLTGTPLKDLLALDLGDLRKVIMRSANELGDELQTDQPWQPASNPIEERIVERVIEQLDGRLEHMIARAMDRYWAMNRPAQQKGNMTPVPITKRDPADTWSFQGVPDAGA